MQRYFFNSLLIIIPAVIVFLCSQPGLVGILEDEMIYLETAESFASDGTFTVKTLPGQPAITKYPPLYPMMLAMVIKPATIFDSWVAQRAYIFLQTSLTAFLAYTLFILWGKRLGLTLPEKFAVMGAFFLNYHLLMIFAAPMSEALFMLAGAILAYLAYPGMTLSQRGKVSLYLSAAVLILTRSIGLPVVAGLSVFFCRCRNYKPMIALIVTLILAVGIGKLYQTHFSSGKENQSEGDFLSYYTSYDYHTLPYKKAFNNEGISGLFRVMGTNVISNLKNGLESVGELLFPLYEESIQSSGRKSVIALATGFCLFTLMTTGLIFMKEYRYLLYMTIPYLLMLLLWTWPWTGRFWVPILPLLLLGLRGFFLRWGRMGTWFFLAFCVATMMMNFPFVIGRMAAASVSQEGIDPIMADDPLEVREYKQLLLWVKQQSSEEKKTILLGGLNTMQKARQNGVQGAWLEPLNGPTPYLKVAVGAKLTPLEREREQLQLQETLQEISHHFRGQPVLVVSDFTLNKRYRHYLDVISSQNSGLVTVFISEGRNIKIYKIDSTWRE